MRKPIVGIACLSQTPSGQIIGDPYKTSRSDLRERTYVHKIRGEHWGCMLTEVVRRYPYPEIKGFIPEGYVWLQIAKDYDDYCINEPLRIYHSGEADALSRHNRRISLGTVLYCQAMIKRDWRFIRWAPMRFFKAGLVTVLGPGWLFLGRLIGH